MLPIPLLTLAILSQSAVLPVENSLHWSASEVVVEEHSRGLYSARLHDYNSQGESGVLLPEKTVMIPVPVSGDVSVQVVPTAVRSLGAVPPIAMSAFEGSRETFVEAPASALPAVWGSVVDRGTFRRTGYVRVQLNPVIVRNGELLSADLEIVVNHADGSRPETVRGHEGDILSEVFGTNSVWREPASRAGESPFWGKPWARIQVDTAGVFQVTAEMIPEAAGMPSGSFSMVTGRGRMMSFEEPGTDAYRPRPVPVLVEDGGDGIFDGEDRVVFYGRGLSWWEGILDGHFNSGYSHENTYWLTWGGSGGPFIESLDGSVTGAPSAGSSYINRIHYEQNLVLEPALNSFQDFYGWHRIASSVPANYSFATPGVTGGGSVRFHFLVYSGSNVSAVVKVNGAVAADTLLAGTGSVIWEFPVSSFKTSGNTMSIQFTGSGHVVYTDWFEVFPETGFRSWSAMCQVPLVKNFPSGERRLVTWAQSLGDESYVFIAESDTAVVMIDTPAGKDFEVPVPEDWLQPVMWVAPGGSLLTPVSVSQASPGRIIETLSSGRTVYIYPEVFAWDMPLFQRGRTDVQMLSLSEIYDEFNGGVRDPNAVRAFFTHSVNTWPEPPTQLILVGDGHWDTRGFTTEKPCFIDILTYRYAGSHPVCSDHLYSSAKAFSLPEAAVSRIPVSTRTELQLVAQKSADYADPSEECGIWQSVVMGAADDERHPDRPSYDETYHTRDTEEVLTGHVPHRLFPLRHYEIFWDWNSNWKKPECRTSFIERWSEGVLALFYLGHGGFDQIADEGLLYIEDTGALACGRRLPYAFFGSCDVGLFQNPSNDCLAEEVITSPAGGAIVSSGASCVSSGGSNAGFLTEIFGVLLNDSRYTIGESQWLGMLNHGAYGSNDKQYIIFGDGSLNLALPDTAIVFQEPELYTSQLCEIQGSLESEGLVMVTAWESARPDSYYTQNQAFLIEYLSTPGVFYRGLAGAAPGFLLSMFVPEVAIAGDLARVRMFAPGEGGGDMVCAYPEELDYGTGSPGDTLGPEIEMWLTGFRGADNPRVSGDVTLEALLSDESGINLLPYPGNQLALYIDGSPLDIADWFTYQQGSATIGGIIYPIQELQSGDHTLRLRAADNQSNIGWQEMSFHLLEESSPDLSDFFVYPTPATTVMSFNWIQSSAGLVSISIYSAAGHRIMEMGNLPGESGYNQHNWDLTDHDGDRVASGMYVYVVSAGDSSISGVTAVAR